MLLRLICCANAGDSGTPTSPTLTPELSTKVIPTSVVTAGGDGTSEDDFRLHRASPQTNATPQTSADSSPSRNSNSGSLNDKLRVDFNELIFHETIGKGSFKTVYRGRWHSTNVAIVRMRKGGMVAEARVMQQLSTHPNLVQFYRWTEDRKNNEYIVMEHVRMGSLDKILRQYGEFLRTRVKLGMCEQICNAMDALIKEGVLHRDLAVRNVLVQSIEPVHVKVSDFGLARDLVRSSTKLSWSSILQSLPVRWVPPEVISSSEWSEKSDVWAYGVTIWEIFSNGAEPYVDLSDEEVTKKVMEGHRLERPQKCPRELYDLMLKCWQHDPQQRPTFAQIVQQFREWRQRKTSSSSGSSRQRDGEPGTPPNMYTYSPVMATPPGTPPLAAPFGRVGSGGFHTPSSMGLSGTTDAETPSISSIANTPNRSGDSIVAPPSTPPRNSPMYRRSPSTLEDDSLHAQFAGQVAAAAAAAATASSAPAAATAGSYPGAPGASQPPGALPATSYPPFVQAGSALHGPPPPPTYPSAAYEPVTDDTLDLTFSTQHYIYPGEMDGAEELGVVDLGPVPGQVQGHMVMVGPSRPMLTGPAARPMMMMMSGPNQSHTHPGHTFHGVTSASHQAAIPGLPQHAPYSHPGTASPLPLHINPTPAPSHSSPYSSIHNLVQHAEYSPQDGMMAAARPLSIHPPSVPVRPGGSNYATIASLSTQSHQGTPPLPHSLCPPPPPEPCDSTMSVTDPPMELDDNTLSLENSYAYPPPTPTLHMQHQHQHYSTMQQMQQAQQQLPGQHPAGHASQHAPWGGHTAAHLHPLDAAAAVSSGMLAHGQLYQLAASQMQQQAAVAAAIQQQAAAVAAAQQRAAAAASAQGHHPNGSLRLGPSIPPLPPGPPAPRAALPPVYRQLYQTEHPLPAPETALPGSTQMLPGELTHAHSMPPHTMQHSSTMQHNHAQQSVLRRPLSAPLPGAALPRAGSGLGGAAGYAMMVVPPTLPHPRAYTGPVLDSAYVNIAAAVENPRAAQPNTAHYRSTEWAKQQQQQQQQQLSQQQQLAQQQPAPQQDQQQHVR